MNSPRSASLLWRALLLPAVFCIATALRAEDPSGVVTGTVANASTRQFLKDALVQIEGTHLATLTDSNGMFRLSRVPAGTRFVVVTFAGLDEERRPVTITAGGTARLDFNLKSEVYILEPFVVASTPEGQAKAINEQRNADNMKSIVASDAFGDLMDNNAAELLKSLPGVVLSYTGEDATDVIMRGQASVNGSITMDGNPIASGGNNGAQGRAVNFRNVSVNNVETIEYNRAPTAADPGNALGGSLNLVSKSAFTQKGRRIRIDVGMNINSEVHSFGRTYQGANKQAMANFPTVQVNYSESFRQNTDHPIGLAITALMGGRYRYNTQYGVSYSYVPGLATGQIVNPSTPVVATGVSYPEASAGFTQTQLAANLDYKLSENTSVFFRGSYQTGPQNHIFGLSHSLRTYAANQTSGSGTSTVALNGNNADTIVSLANAQVGSTAVAAGSSSGSRIAKTTGHELSRNQTYQFTLGARQRLGDLSLDYDGYYSRAFDRRTVSGNPYTGTLTYDVTNIGFTQTQVNSLSRSTLTQTYGPSYKDVANYGRITWTEDCRYSQDSRTGAKINARLPFNKYSFPILFQAGMSDNYQERFTTGASGVNRIRFGAGADDTFGTADDVSLPLADFVDTNMRGRWNMRGYNINPGDWIDATKLFAYYKLHPESGTPNSIGPVDAYYANAKTFKEDILAAYAMATIKIRRFTIVPGYRFEKTSDKGYGYACRSTAYADSTKSDYIADVVKRQIARYYPVSRDASYHNYFRNLQAKYDFTKNLLARAAFTENIGRQNFGSLLPGDTVYDSYSMVIRNNPDLLPYMAKNYDLSLEYYFGKKNIGSLTASVYRKTISNYTQMVSSTIGAGADNGFNGQYEGYTLSTYENISGSTRTDGVELGYNQALRFLPGVLKNLSTNASFTYTHGTPAPGSTTVTGIYPKVYNLGLSYNSSRIRVDLKYNMRKRMLYSINSTTDERTYTDDNDRLDVSLNLRFRRNYAFYFDWRNCLNEKDVRRTAGSRIASCFHGGTSINTGVRADF